MEPIRLGAVEYLNTAPLIEGLDRVEGLELVPMVPASLGPALAEGAIDLGLVSVIDAARSAEPLTIVPVGMIGCDGPTLTVRLSSRVPLPEITAVHADAESHTSAALCRILLERVHGVRAELHTFDASAPDLPDTVLRIGDKVITRPLAPEGFAHELDLGEAWRTWTGLPMVYAAWMCRSRALDDGPSRNDATGTGSPAPGIRPHLETAAALLDRQRRHNAGRLDWIATRWAERRHWPIETARDYLVRMLRYDLDARAREGLARFLQEAASLGLIESAEVRFLDRTSAATG